MLLGSPDIRKQYANEETFIIQLLGQNRYAEAYRLLQNEPPEEASTQYNMALCHYWAGNYRQALLNLDKAQAKLPVNNTRDNAAADDFYNRIREQQLQQNDHLQAISKKYIALFGDLFKDAITRLKTDCWLQLHDYARMMEVATPLAHKNYKNIADALQTAKNILAHEQ